MLALYLFSLVLGGGFLLVSLLGAGEGGDLDMDADLALDAGDLDLDFDAGDVDFDTELDADHGVAAGRIFSFRSVVYGMFGFGATGSILTWLGMGTLSTAAFSVVGGALSGLMVGSLFRWLKASESGAQPSDRGLIGRTGTVTLPMSATSAGAVVVERGRRRVTLRALPHGSGTGDPTAWRSVLVVEMEGGVARVAPLEDDELVSLPGPEGEEDPT